MKKQAGIWIDAKQAIIVYLNESGQEMKKVQSDIEKKVRVPGEGKWFTRMGNQFFNFDRKKEAHRVRDTQAFFKDIQQELAGVEELVLFGPAAKKSELEKYLQEQGPSGCTIQAVQPADSMTDNQVAAWVRQFFNR